MGRRKNKSRRSKSADNGGNNFGQRVSIQPSSNENNSDSNNVFQMDRILCRAYSLDSNISDLSGSIGGHRSRGASNKAEDENVFMSILNDCATLTGINELVAEGQAALMGKPDDKKRSSRKNSQPNVWGVSPTTDDESSDDSAKQRRKLEKEEENIQHDNIELVLDNNFKTSADTAGNINSLKKRVSSVLRRQEASPTNKDLGPSLLDDNEGGTPSDPAPIEQVDIPKDAASGIGSTASGQKKSSRKLFRFPLNPAKKSNATKKSNVTKKKASPFQANSKQATREQIEEAKNWKSTVDKSTGKVYYYNSKTKQTVWKKPVGYDEACKELASQKDGGVASLWKATVDPSTGKTYYYNKKTKEVSWTIPEGYRSGDDLKVNSGEKKAEGDGDIGKYWRETVDTTSGKTYYYNKKTKEVSWEKPAGFIPASLKKIDENAQVEKAAPVKDTQSNIQYDTPFDEEPPDAPFDEPDGAPASPKKAHFGNADETPDAMSLYSRTKSLKSVELTKQRTYASAMTDTTKKVANTGMPARDFTNTQINLIKDTEEEETSPPPKMSPTRVTNAKAPIVSPTSPKRRYRTKKAENLGSDDDSGSDDWSDEVSELSGIGNEVDAGAKGNGNKQKKESRTESSSLRESSDQDISTAKRKDDPQNWTQEQLDSFIAKNDWGQVAKYIAESRKTAGAVPQTKAGGMTKMQQDAVSQVSADDDDDDSVWQSLDDDPEGNDASFDYDKVATRQPVPAVQ